MTCLICGEICRCSSETHSDLPPRWLADEVCTVAASPEVEQMPSGAEFIPQPQAEESLANQSAGAEPEDSSVWRRELAARLNQYQSRRKPRPPRYPSLRLRFEENGNSSSGAISSQSAAYSPAITSSPALALDPFAGASAATWAEPSSSLTISEAERSSETLQSTGFHALANAASSPVPVKAKILEFPRSWTPPPAPFDELAEPVTDRPRILEAPEVVPPPPALGGITIDPAPQPSLEKRPGIDFPLQSAPVARRVLSALIDDAVLAVASTLFGFIFWKMISIRPPRLQMVELGVGLTGAFWAAYQYLLVVYSGTTPGLRLAGLELARFDGSTAGRGLRRWRILASFLSALSLGMGYAWAFLDEDALCWHDRITHTYLAPKRRRTEC